MVIDVVNLNVLVYENLDKKKIVETREKKKNIEISKAKS